MQELFQRFSELVLSGDKHATKILNDLERDKRSGSIKRPQSVVDSRSTKIIYDIIAAESDVENLGEDDDNDNEDA